MLSSSSFSVLAFSEADLNHDCPRRGEYEATFTQVFDH